MAILEVVQGVALGLSVRNSWIVERLRRRTVVARVKRWLTVRDYNKKDNGGSNDVVF